MKGLIKENPIVGATYSENLPIPNIRPNEALVRVRASAICGTDIHIYDWTKYAQERLQLPMVFGHEFSGEIVELGAEVTGFAVGDRVAGETHIPCEQCEQCRTGNEHICENMLIIGVHTAGAFAEYVPVHKGCLWKLDDSIDFETGALLEPVGVGVHGVLSGEIGGKSVAIFGCGPIGLCAVGAAKACGASTIYAVDLVDEKLTLAQKLGADFIINSSIDDVGRIVFDKTDGKGVDVVIDYTGSEQAIRTGLLILKKEKVHIVGLSMETSPLISTNLSYIRKHASTV